MRSKIVSPSLSNLGHLTELFCQYRTFYKQPLDFEKTRKFVFDRLNMKDSIFFMAYEKGSKVAMGFTQLYPSFTSVGMQRIYILNDLYVAPEYRGKGVSKALLTRAHEFSIENGAQKVSLMTADNNIIAQKLYESLDYNFDTQFSHYNFILPQNNITENSFQKLRTLRTSYIKENLELRAVTAKDLESLSVLFDKYRTFYKKESDISSAKKFLETRLMNNDSKIFILENNETASSVGFAQLYPCFTSVGLQRTYILNDLYIIPEYRNQGIGKCVLDFIHQYCMEEGAQKVSLMTAKDNIHAQKLYEKKGYILDTTFKHYNLHFPNIAQEVTPLSINHTMDSKVISRH
ncbi:hypothetical protein NF27_DN00060 [Candidatus Jidaibacter acanthamoeba]|uniref:N-acetyltransferase domain-containing protein n=1 Tax=Candidatus Jidaibacter acanthamoebae TaxID=86105 RepID=A0A0C1R066_9RICK|nr:GNAT family N-acetyltransferase [Candidatus Jidaibacter acanthamoeba]KIE05690.1 hypothetical protein NF27_DN00060 [Candidatus Jidaibacter acanthamoeba]